VATTALLRGIIADFAGV